MRSPCSPSSRGAPSRLRTSACGGAVDANQAARFAEEPEETEDSLREYLGGRGVQSLVRTKTAYIRLNVVASGIEEAEERQGTLGPVVDQLRTGASLNVIVAGDRSFEEILHDTSMEPDVVFLGMATPEEQPDYVSYYEKLQERTDGLPPTVFVLAAENISFREVLT